MAEAQSQSDAAAAETTEEGSLLDSILSKVDVKAPAGDVRIDAFSDADAVGGQDRGAMMSAALRVFVDAVAKSGDPIEKIDKHLVDGLVADIDATISRQLDKILHSAEVQKLESAWRGLKFLVDRTDFR
ncbi:MAG: type VI secretion system contractile sheath large subunit, partial [Bacteroidota bacterium]